MAQPLTLWPEQEQILVRVHEGFLAGHRAQIVYGPCGFGKTEIAVSMLDATAKKLDKKSQRPKRSAMLLDLKLLCAQTSARLEKYGIDHGIVQPKSPRWRPELPIQVCMVQTLEAREGFPAVNLLVVDEAHMMRASVIEFIRNNPDVYVVGLSGSPFTKGMGSVYTNVVSGVTVNDLVSKGRLINPRVFIAKQIDMTGAKKVAGEWSDKETTARGIKITGDVVAEWVSKTQEVFGGPRKTIVFCAGVSHGADLAQKFSEAGFNFVSISYKDDEDYKRQVLDDFDKPDTEINGLIATDLLTKGFDCILEGTPVLTQRGEVPIERVLPTDKVWDGVEFVSHQGAIFKGVQDVITYAGITATADHRVFTSAGWAPLGDVATNEVPIARTGLGSLPISLADGAFEGGQISLPVRDERVLRELRWTGHPISLSVSTGCGILGGSGSGHAGRWNGVGPDQERRPLRAGESSMGDPCTEQLSHQAPAPQPSISSNQTALPRGQVCGQNAAQSSQQGIDDRADCRPVQPAVRQAKGRVWDLLGAGPRNRFTAAGLLIHNCTDVCVGVSARPFSKSFSAHVQQLGRIMRPHEGKESAIWLDHSGNFLRFRDQWDELCADGVSELDDGAEKVKPEPTDQEKEAAKCPKCGHLWNASSDVCSHCGFVRARKNDVVAVPGEMTELTLVPKKEKYSAEFKRDFYAELIGWTVEKNKKPGLAYYKYIEKFGVGPSMAKPAPRSPGPEVLSWIKSRNIAYSNRKVA